MTDQELDEITQLVAELGSLNYFPADLDSRRGITRDIVAMAWNIEQVRWLIARMRSMYEDWPGPRVMREIFCNRFPPRDNVDPCLLQREDGFGGPMKALSEKDRLKVLAAGPEPLEGPKLLGSGEPVSQDPTIAGLAAIALVGIAARSSTLSEAATAEEIRTAPAWLRELEGYSTPETVNGSPPVRWDETAGKDGKGGWVPV